MAFELGAFSAPILRFVEGSVEGRFQIGTRFPGVTLDMNRASKFRILSALLVLLLLPAGLRAQWVTQTIPLSAGFNAVHLQVTPADPLCDAVFAGVPSVREVWMYNRYLQTATFTTNSTETASGQDHWITWYPPGGNKAFLRTLAQLRGGQSYLIKLDANALPTTLTVRGIPASPRSDWIPNDVVLAGFPIKESEKVTFRQFLKDSPQVSAASGTDSGVFTINPLTAFETRIRNPELTTIVPGRAYWTFLQGHARNPYPFEVAGTGENGAVVFLQDNPLATLTVRNGTAVGGQTVRIRLKESETAPPNRPKRAGGTPVAALVPSANGTYGVRNLAEGMDVVLDAGESRQLRLGLLVQELVPTSDTNSTYQGLLEVTDEAHGYRQLVPVVAEVPGSRLNTRRGSLLGAERPGRVVPSALTSVASAALNAGLWVGHLTLDAVNQLSGSQSASLDPSLAPPISAPPLSTRVLIHVDSNGVARLMHQVLFAEVSNGTNRVTRMYGSLTGVPPGAVIKSRISAPSWPAAAPTSMMGFFGSNVTATLVLPFNDRLNPFVHRYHPDHNNLAEDLATPLANGRESFEITRNVSFYFGDTVETGPGTYAPSVPAMRFSGTNGESVATSAFSTTASHSMQLWLNVATLQQNGATILYLTNAARASSARLAFQANTGLLTFAIRNTTNGVGQIVSESVLPTSRWVNVATTYDETGYASLYINGVRVGGGSVPSLGSGAWESAWIGNQATGGAASLLGSVHDVVIRSGALGQALVPQVMVVPQLLNSTHPIVLNVRGDGTANGVVSNGSASVNITMSSNTLLDLDSAPSVPLWTYGSAQGTYQETVVGLRRQAVTLRGFFQFTRVNQDSFLF